MVTLKSKLHEMNLKAVGCLVEVVSNAGLIVILNIHLIQTFHNLKQNTVHGYDC